MKNGQGLLIGFFILSVSFVSFWLVLSGCASAPTLQLSEELPDIVKQYKRVTIYTWQSDDVNTNIYLKKGTFFSIFTATYEARYYLDVEISGKPVLDTYFATSPADGYLLIGCYNTSKTISANYDFEIVVWKEKDWERIDEFLQAMKQKNPQSIDIDTALMNARRHKEIRHEEVKTAQKIDETKGKIQQFKALSVKEEQSMKTAEGSHADNKENEPIDKKEKQEIIAHLETKLAELTETLDQLEEAKHKLKMERNKSNLLAKKLEQRKKQEAQFLTKSKETSSSTPVIVVTSPRNRSRAEAKVLHVQGVAKDRQGILKLEFFVNDIPIQPYHDRGIKLVEKPVSNRVDFRKKIALRPGMNTIKIKAVNISGLYSEEILRIQYVEKRKHMWAVVIGINNYPHVRKLKYAVNDAKLFYDYLVDYNHVPSKHMTLLLDQDASLGRIRSVLGTSLKKKASKEDMVIIFFAGHGAIEKDSRSPDGDGLEKYILPYNANPKDLYATALPMAEISRIFRRIQSERLVLIADTCYSGAAGGRTIGLAGIRSHISDSFLDRVVSGKGRVIITASGANEVSVERNELQHGVFTYYLVKALKGAADIDSDGLLALDEVFTYLSKQVPKATAQQQHPVKKGVMEGRLILGVTK